MSPKKLLSGEACSPTSSRTPRSGRGSARHWLGLWPSRWRVYRVAHRLSQAALSKRPGVSQPVIARIERGDHTPNWETLGRLARLMDVHFPVGVDPVAGPRLSQVSSSCSTQEM